MGYTLKKRGIRVEINGATYEISYGSADLIDEVAGWQRKLQGIDYSSLGEGRTKALQADIDGFLRALLGQDQLAGLKRSVGDWDLLIAIEAFAILCHEIAEANVSGSIKGVLDKYLPDEAEPLEG